jgi:hypothetical protein
MPNLDFQQKTEKLLGMLYETVNGYLSGDYEVTLVCQRTDVDQPSGLIAGTGDNAEALKVLEDHVEGQHESDIVVRSR